MVSQVIYYQKEVHKVTKKKEYWVTEGYDGKKYYIAICKRKRGSKRFKLFETNYPKRARTYFLKLDRWINA
jgi:hypothetical protein